MPSIAQVVIDHYNGVEPQPTQVVAPAKPAKRAAPVLTEQDHERKRTVLNALSRGTWTVEFIKADGTHSCMECTRDSRLIPSDPTQINVADPSKTHTAEHLVHVYSLDRQGWRSFDIQRLKKIYEKTEAL